MSTSMKISQEIQFASYVVVVMRVAMCFKYSARLAYLRICIEKYIKTCGISEDNTKGSSVMQGWRYIRRQNGSVYLESLICMLRDAMMRCVQLSPPSSHQPSKRLSKDMPPKSFDVDDARAFSLTSFEGQGFLLRFNKGCNFLQSAFWMWITKRFSLVLECNVSMQFCITLGPTCQFSLQAC